MHSALIHDTICLTLPAVNNAAVYFSLKWMIPLLTSGNNRSTGEMQLNMCFTPHWRPSIVSIPKT